MRDTVVVDTSIAIKWVLREDDSQTAFALLTEWTDKDFQVIAPALLAYEVANGLYKKIRKGEISLARAREALAEVLLIGLELDFSQDPTLSTRAIELANQYGLSAAYDAHYLALAESEGCEFWTADKRLWNAISGKLAWVRWMGNYQPTNQHTSPDESDSNNF